MDQPDNTMDRLTSLPTELLEMILELAVPRKRPYLGPVCKAVLPLVRSICFSHLTVYGADSLSRFADAVEADRSLGTAVTKIVLDSGTEQKEPTLGWQDVRQLFKRLPLIKEFTVDFLERGVEVVVDVLLRPPRNGSQLPKLEVLKLKCRTFSDENQFSAQRYSLLDRYPHLDALELDIWNKHGGGWRGSAGELMEPLSTPTSWWLSLTGELSANPAIYGLVRLFPSVDALRIIDHDDGAAAETAFCPAAEAVAALRDPSDLTVLAVHFHSTRPSVDLLPLALELPNLSSFELGGATFFASSFPDLSWLQYLSRLVLVQRSDFSTTDLVPLLDLPSLRTLRLDLGYKPNESFSSFDPFDYPGWTPSFTFDGLSSRIDLAESKGVKVIGLAAGLVRRERDYQERVAKWMKRMEEGATV